MKSVPYSLQLSAYGWKGVVAVLFGLWVATASELTACGIDWSIPRGSPFENVNEQGHVLFVDTIGTLDLGKEDLKIPIYLLFKSDWNLRSPLAGHAWMIPLLESRIFQQDENTFILWQPNGQYRTFWRSKESPNNILSGQGNWKAELRGDSLVAYADCGWKLSYLKGKIQSMQTPPPKGSDGLQKGRKLDFVYTNGRVSGIRVDGIEKLSVEYDSLTGEAKALVVNSKRIEIELDQKPRVQNINGQNLVGGMERSLHRLRLADGSVRTYTFGVDKRLQPTLTVSGISERTFTWDPFTRRIISDSAGNWTYDIKPNEKDPLANAAIGRKNSKGESNYWHYDGAHGQEIIGEEGTRTVRRWFMSGPMAGKIRRVEKVSDGKTKVVQQFSYDERGKLIREVGSDGVSTSFQYDKQGRLIEVMRAGEPFARRKYDDKNRTVEEETVGIEKSSIRYLTNGEYEKTTTKTGGGKSIETFSQVGSLISAKYSDGRGLAAFNKTASSLNQGSVKAREDEVRKLAEKIEKLKDPIARGDLLLEMGRLYSQDTCGPEDPRSAIAIYERIIADPTTDDLTKARAHAWAWSGYISLGRSERKNVRRHAEALLSLSGDHLQPHQLQDFQAEKACAFRLLLGLEAEDGPLSEKAGRILLTGYGNSDAFKKQLEEMLTEQRIELARNYFKRNP